MAAWLARSAVSSANERFERSRVGETISLTARHLQNRSSAGGVMKRREASQANRADAPPEPPLDFEDFEDVDIGDDEDFITLDTVEILVTEHNGSSSRVICIAIEGDSTGVTAIPPAPTTRARA